MNQKQRYYMQKPGSYCLGSLLLVLGLFFFSACTNSLNKETKENKPLETSSINKDIIDGIHVRTGLKEGEGLLMVIGHCTACHSAQLITQNRMTKEQWNATIRWMQETQNLWDLGENQEVIVNYLVTNYPVIDTGRRENLHVTEWYTLEE